MSSLMARTLTFLNILWNGVLTNTTWNRFFSVLGSSNYVHLWMELLCCLETSFYCFWFYFSLYERYARTSICGLNISLPTQSWLSTSRRSLILFTKTRYTELNIILLHSMTKSFFLQIYILNLLLPLLYCTTTVLYYRGFEKLFLYCSSLSFHF